MGVTSPFPVAPHPAPAQGSFIPFVFPGLPHVGCAFTTAIAGTMSLLAPVLGEDALANRRRMAARLGFARWAEFRQVHGTDFLIDPAPTEPDAPPETKADGGCTNRRNTALIIKTADCQPILFTDKKGTAVAALHAGWRGNAADYPGMGLARFCEAYRLKPEDVMAVRGPSLGPGAAQFVNFETEWPPRFRPWFDETRRTMNLWELLRHQLIEAGMRPEHIFSLDLCTWSLPDLFFSHRRGHTGRQLSAIWIRDS